MIKFFGAPMSSSGRTRWMLEEVGVPYEYTVVNLHDEEARRRYLEIFPGGKVPYLVDGDVKLFESMAINFYLAERYGPELLPRDLELRAQVYQWSFWSITNLQPEALKYMGHGTFAPDDERGVRHKDEARASCRRYLDQLEASLTGRYLVGDSFTVADVNCGSIVNLTQRANVGVGPRVAEWMDTLRDRPAWKRASQEVSLR